MMGLCCFLEKNVSDKTDLSVSVAIIELEQLLFNANRLKNVSNWSEIYEFMNINYNMRLKTLREYGFRVMANYYMKEWNLLKPH